MTAGPQEFIRQLVDLGYDPRMLTADFIAVSYPVEAGPLAGEEIELGFRVPGDFGITPPGGLLVRPHILPLNPETGPGHPFGAVHPALTAGVNDGSWQYWSRPHPNWPGTDRTVRAHFHGHIRTLFATLPHGLKLRTEY
jgi:hypothetical protein